MTKGVDLAGHSAFPFLPDADPLDKVGHGTHVASIVAAMAPDAEIWAVKVFGDDGSGTYLAAAGVEWALDPNGDSDTSDRADVINLSLGVDFLSPDDPLTVALRAALDLGVVVVVTAGNSGDMPTPTRSPAGPGTMLGSLADGVASPHPKAGRLSP